MSKKLLRLMTALLLLFPLTAAALDYPYKTAEPQKTGWPLTDEERAYVLKPEHERRPGRESNKHLPAMWPVVPSAGHFGGTAWLDTHAKLVDYVQINKGPIDILLVGDSITQQWGSPLDKKPLNAAWQKQFAKYKTMNIGIGGDKSQNVLWRLDHGGVEGLEPRLVVVLIGNNNMFFAPETGVEAAAKGIEMCVANVRDKFPKAAVIAVKIFPAHAPGNRFYEDIQKTNAALDALKLDRDPKVHVLDLTSDFLNADGTLKRTLFAPDDIHLSLEGYGVFAERLKPIITLQAVAIPQSVEQLWADFDPRKDALETEVIREFKEDGGVFRHVRFVVGTFKGKTARMTAIYGFPDAMTEKSGDAITNKKLPAVMHIHGGGQRAFLSEVKLLVSRGYAALSVNWGGSGNGNAPFNSVEGAQPGDQNTDWGEVDPSQLNVPGYNSIKPGPKQLYEDIKHPKNNNWYLLTVGCRRGLTFLEQQPEVDPERLGVHGYSMGGNLTMYVAGTDRRVKAAVPGVGGQGWRWEAHEFLGGSVAQSRVAGDVDLFRRTLSFESYAPLIRCPVLHRSATNDFHGWMDDVYRTNGLIPNQSLRYSWTPHVNHRLSPEVAITMPLWFDQHLKGGPALPETPASKLVLQTAEHVPVLRVIPDSKSLRVARVEIYYSVDPDPRARFWRSADFTREGAAFVAKLPLHTLDLPLFAFANAYHTLSKPESLAAIPGNGKPVTELCLSSEFHTVTPAALKEAGVVASLKASPLIDDFAAAHGLRDWYPINEDHPPLVQHWTRKLTDPAWRGRDGAKLKLTLKMPTTNTLSFVVIENEWRSHRGPRKTFVCEREITGSDAEQTIILEAKDFVSDSGPLKSWDGVDQFAICRHFAERGTTATRKPSWTGPAPTFMRLEWE